MVMSGENLDNFVEVKNILVEMGTYFQVQDDYLDCFGAPEVIVGTDIEDFKCSWLIVQALERANENQMKLLSENYGKSDPACVTKVKAVYNDLNLQDTIHNAIEDFITWPIQKIVPILLGDYSGLELKPIGVLEVKLVQAKGLANKDLVGKSDPFAVAYIRPLPDRMKTSKTINNELNPIWNEHFEFIVEDMSTQRLVVKVYDDEGVQASELIGMAQFKLQEL
ncbi:uncharacterized protein A4U43_C05F12930 [Asparagus officinalis]|uniref:C2 domain-containing protein n=1 Tax=Asparagus officinalis TaxID=4686 RepID=A0A5P1ES97_ASPOF|nr:uncharacterized protein A4U43_C05F12930 [Asparagus officinalis]